MVEALVVEALRTPLLAPRGRGGALAPEALAALALRGVVHRAGVDPAQLDAAFVGGAAPGLGRMAVAAARLPLSLPATTVGAGHASGLAALALARQAVSLDPMALVLAAGVSGPVPPAAPGEVAHERAAWLPPEQAAALVAARAGVDAEEALAWAAARPPEGSAGVPASEVVDLDGAFADEVCDGGPAVAAAALLLAGGEAVLRHRLRVRARLVSAAAAALDPALAPLAVVPAALRALEAAGLEVVDLDLVELDLASPAVALAAAGELGLDPARIGAIGFPAARVEGLAGLPRLCRLVHALEARGARFGLCAAADGLGQAWAVVVDRTRYR